MISGGGVLSNVKRGLRKIADPLGLTGGLVYVQDLLRAHSLLSRLRTRLAPLHAESEGGSGTDSQRGARRAPAPGSNARKIIINATRPILGLPFHLESVIGRGLAFEDTAAVRVLWDDGVLNHWDTVTRSDPRTQKFLFRFGRFYAPRLLSRFGLSHRPYSSLFSSMTREEVRSRFSLSDLSLEDIRAGPSIEYKGVDVGEHAFASTIRYFRRGYIPSSEDVESYYCRSVINGALATDVARQVVRQEAPDIVVTSHGLYSTWGPFFDTLRNAGVDVTVYGLAGAQTGTVTLIKNSFLQAMGTDESPAPPSVGHDLNGAERIRIKSFLEKRFSHEIGDVKHYDEIRTTTEMPAGLTSGDERPLFVLFSNVLWDAVVAGRQGVFASPIEWVVETAEYFVERPDLRLVLKAHPSEVNLMNADEGLCEILERRAPEALAAENISFLEPRAAVDPYELGTLADAGIVLTGTVGLELSCMGEPVIVCGKPHYAHCVYTTPTRDDYFAAFDRVPELRDAAARNKERALAHAHWYFLEAPHPVPFADENRWGAMALEDIESPADLDPDENERISEIVRTILRYTETA